jgi:hypothetical protein
MRFPFLVCMSLSPLSLLLPMLLLPRLPTAMTQFLFRVSHTVLLWFRVIVMRMLRFLSRAQVFLAFPPRPPLLLFTLKLPCRLAAADDALSGMVQFDFFLFVLLLLLCFFTSSSVISLEARGPFPDFAADAPFLTWDTSHGSNVRIWSCCGCRAFYAGPAFAGFPVPG